MLSSDLDLMVSVDEVKMHLSSQLAARKDMTEQLSVKKRMVRLCVCVCVATFDCSARYKYNRTHKIIWLIVSVFAVVCYVFVHMCVCVCV